MMTRMTVEEFRKALWDSQESPYTINKDGSAHMYPMPSSYFLERRLAIVEKAIESMLEEKV